MDVIQLLKQLIAIPSITPTDGGCLALIADQLTPVGFQMQDFNAQGVANRWYVHGKGAPVVVFLGHVDVVPTGPREKWQFDPFDPQEHEGVVYGRGAADMKGGVAAMTIALAQFVRENPQHRGTLAMLLTSDEEGPAVHGTTMALQALQKQGQTFDFGIVGEPTCAEVMGDCIKNGRRGSLTALLTILGKQGHVAYPHKANNAFHRALPFLSALTQKIWDQGNDDFPPTTLQIANVRAGTGAGNVIPGECVFDINWRHGTASSTSSLMERTESLLSECGLIKDQDYRIEWNIGAQPYLTTARRLIETLSFAVHQVTGINPRLETTGGTSDGRFLAQYCQEVVEFGTRNATIHQVNERVNKTEVEQLTQIYRQTLIQLLS